MNLLQKKKDFEQYFHDNYNETDIHWIGSKWIVEDHDEWIRYEYKGTSTGTSGLSNVDYTDEGIVIITVVSETMFRCNDIADIAVSLFQGSNISGMFMEKANILTQGVFDDNGKSFIDIELRFYMV